MFEIIKDFIEFRKLKYQRVMSCKRFVVTQAMVKFYEDLQRTKGNLDLPPFICAYNAMKELKTDKALNGVYKKMEMAGLV
jgi:hypothetical protein